MNTTGYYGKMPQRGDFVSGKIPTTFKNTWDDWAQQLVNVSDEIKLNGADNPWFKLPVYRFYLSSGVAGDNAWIGIMLPSSDSVGRLFPFCLARDIDPTLIAPQALTLHQPYFQQLEELLKQLYEKELDFTHLNDKLSQLDEETSIVTEPGASVITTQSEEPALSVKLEHDIANSTDWETAATAILQVSCTAYSIWTTSPLSKSSSETLICEALPSTRNCGSFFSGDFNALDWTQSVYDKIQPGHREDNILTKEAVTPSLVATEDTDTKPIRKTAIPGPERESPRETDFLELDDDSVQPDDPWDT